MRLLFDENLSALSALWVSNTLAIDVLDARSAGLAGKSSLAESKIIDYNQFP
jgi:hypothetical protein